MRPTSTCACSTSWPGSPPRSNCLTGWSTWPPPRSAGRPPARRYAVEVWRPARHGYREVASAANHTTFLARRLRIRHRRTNGPRVAATLSATLAGPGWLAAVLENHQRADGSVRVPAALRPYLG